MDGNLMMQNVWLAWLAWRVRRSLTPTLTSTTTTHLLLTQRRLNLTPTPVPHNMPSSTTPVANANNATNKPNPNPNTDRVNRAAEDAKHDALTAVQLREHLLESFPHLTSTGSSARSTLTRFDRRARGQGTAAAGPRRLDCHGFACAWQEYRGSSTRSHGCARVARPLRHRLPMVGNATDYVSPPPASTGARRQSWYETGAKYKRRADAAVLARPPKRVRFDQTHKKNGGSSGYLRTIKEGSESSNTIDGDYVDEPRNKE
ncbi:hypothetical protein IWX47DRAFT_848639 [Phyllosticta citricarpa]